MVLGLKDRKEKKEKKKKEKASSKLDVTRASSESFGFEATQDLFQRMGSDKRNRDPGVESEEEEHFDDSKSLRSVTFDVTPASNDRVNVTSASNDGVHSSSSSIDKKPKGLLTSKLKNSYRNLLETGRSGSLFNLRQQKEKDEKKHLSTRDLRYGSGIIKMT